MYTKLQLVILHNAVASRTIHRSDCPDKAALGGIRKEPNENLHKAKMISYSPRLLFDWITVQMCFEGDKSKCCYCCSQLAGMRTWRAERTSQKDLRNNVHIQKHVLILYHRLFLFYLLCMDVYMQSNAWQRSCVRSPAIKKKPKGQGEGVGWGAAEKKERGGGGRQQRRHLFFLRNEAAERSRHGKAGEWENGAESDCISPEPSSQTLH